MPSENTKRLAKNTFVLYFRMLFLLAISLYTSRVILQILGIEDYGIYNVVGGFVAMFAVISRSLSMAASRFLNFEMGKGNDGNLNGVFSTILILHFFLAIIIAILLEGIGIWFITNKMVIPVERLDATKWVFQFSVLTFCFNLISVPYNASIIAHEQMKVYAYIGVGEGLAKLGICFLLKCSPIDKLVFYSLLMFLIQFTVRIVYQRYCKKHYSETKFRFVYDKFILKEIFGFVGWNTIGASAAVLRNQGGNVLLNLFGGPALNAARGVANQVLHAVSGFVSNFMTAINPQITKSYASGNRAYLMMLVYKGARFSYYLLLVLSMPILLSTDYILHIWLKIVPDYSIAFVQLSLIFNMVEVISTPLGTVQLATGKIRTYQIIVGGLTLLNLPLSYLFLRLGYSPEIVYYVAIALSFCVLIARLFLLKNMIQLNVLDYIKKVVLNIFMVTFASFLVPFIISRHLVICFSSFCWVSLSCILFTLLSIFIIGFSNEERAFVLTNVRRVLN